MPSFSRSRCSRSASGVRRSPPRSRLRFAINELRIDQPSTDNDEYFELLGTPETSLDGYTLVVLGDGAAALGSGVIESVTSLNGATIPADGFFVVAESTFTLGTAGPAAPAHPG